MRTMKDNERFFLITKIFLDLNGPSTSAQISNYIKKCPVRLERDYSPIRVGTLLRGQNWVTKERNEKKKITKYKVKV